MIEILKSKKGEATYIYLCVLIIVMTLLISIVILYMGLMEKLQVQKRDMQAKLDDYIAEYAIGFFDALKQGDSYKQYIDYDDLIEKCPSYLGFNKSGIYIYPRLDCRLINPRVDEIRGDGFGVVLSYTVMFPLKWNGKVFANISLPVTISSYYNIKYSY